MLMYAQFLVQECVYVQDTSFLHVLYQAVTVCDALCDDCLPRSFCYFFFFFFSFLFFDFHFSLKLFLICSYFSGDLSLTVLIKCVLNKKKSVLVLASLNGKTQGAHVYFPAATLPIPALWPTEGPKRP